MYHNELCISEKIRDRSYGYSKNTLSTTQGLLIKLYILSTKYIIPTLQNDCIDAIILYSRTIELVHLSTYIWENTSPNAKLRDLVVRMIGDRYCTNDLKEDSLYIGPELMLALAVAAFGHRDKGYNRFRDQVSPRERFCKEFHVHDTGPVGQCTKIKEYVMAEREKLE